MTELLEAALRYMPRTIPLAAGTKRPSVGEGWPDWPATRESVTAWYAEHPDDNVGIRCGDINGNGLAVVDIDPRHGGAESHAALEADHGPLPATPTVLTGRDDGGTHHYYRAPAGLQSAINPLPGIEIRAERCQVVAPPSVHPDTGKLYVWDPAHPLIEAEIAPLPESLVRLAGFKGNPGPERDFADLVKRDPLHRIPSRTYVRVLAGLTPNLRGYARCPFHSGDNDPSLKVYERGGWRCYGPCDVGGRIYQFAGLLGGWNLPLTPADRREIRAELISIFAQELAA